MLCSCQLHLLAKRQAVDDTVNDEELYTDGPYQFDNCGLSHALSSLVVDISRIQSFVQPSQHGIVIFDMRFLAQSDRVTPTAMVSRS